MVAHCKKARCNEFNSLDQGLSVGYFVLKEFKMVANFMSEDCHLEFENFFREYILAFELVGDVCICSEQLNELWHYFTGAVHSLSSLASSISRCCCFVACGNFLSILLLFAAGVSASSEQLLLSSLHPISLVLTFRLKFSNLRLRRCT